LAYRFRALAAYSSNQGIVDWPWLRGLQLSEKNIGDTAFGRYFGGGTSSTGNNIWQLGASSGRRQTGLIRGLRISGEKRST
jgi:hypothetical protein